MRPRTVSLLVTLGVFLGALGLVWGLSGGGGGRASESDQTFVFPLNSTKNFVSVRSPWRRGHMTPQDDQVELTLEGTCATAHLYAYLSTGWDHGPVDAASVILGEPLHPVPGAGPPPAVVRHNATSALVLSRPSGRGVLAIQAAARDYDILLVIWQGKSGCSSKQLGHDARQLGRLFETFKLNVPRRSGTA
jgi:hypothetical protein